VTLALIAILGATAVAWANGANDVSKGVATLIGSRLASYHHGLVWGTAWTIGGAAAAWALSSSMLRTFSTELVAGGFAGSALFPVSVAAGAFAWVLIASRTGLPVSTTHSLTGGIVGTAVAASGLQGVNWTLVLGTVAVPLAVSPFLAAGLSYAAHSALPRVMVDDKSAGSDGGAVDRLPARDAAHWMASGALSFARALNDTPKIAALGAAAASSTGLNAAWLFAVCALAMGAGSLLIGMRVTRTLAERITSIDPLEGLSASGVAATLVLFASIFALPVSTTHVASGAIVGAGLRAGARAIHWNIVSSVAAAWVITLPVSALISAATWQIAQTIGG
jgi:PiT family inorganic phosphate transporter